MATILDSGLASTFTSIFIFLLVYAIVYGILTWRKMFGPSGRSMSMIIGVVIALIASVAPPAKQFITFIAPWYVALFITIFFILFIISMFGKSPERDFPSIIGDPRVYSWVIIFCVIIFIIGLGMTFGPGLTPGGTTPTAENVIMDQNMKIIGGDNLAQPGRLAPPPVRGQQAVAGGGAGTPGSTATTDFSTNMINTIFHPKVLGLMVTFLIAAVTVFFLSYAPSGR